MFRMAGLFFILLSFSFSVRAGQRPFFDVLDTAFLFPYSFDNGEWQPPTAPLLPVYTGSDEDLLTSRQKEIFLELMQFSSPGLYWENPFELLNPITQQKERLKGLFNSWDQVIHGSLKVYMSAVRFEICGPGVRHHSGNFQKIETFQWVNGHVEKMPVSENCRPRIQVVVQPPNVDTAAHLIYILPEEETQKILQHLSSIKSLNPVSTNGKPLGVHPGFFDEDNKERFANAIIDFTRNFARHEHLSEIAFYAFDDHDEDEWVFLTAHLNSGGTEFELQPNLALVGLPLAHRFSVTSSSEKSLFPVHSLSAVKQWDFSKKNFAYTPIEAVLAAIETNIHPLKTNSRSSECKSCHSPSGHMYELRKNPKNFGLAPSFKVFESSDVFTNPSQIFYVPGVTGFPDSRYLSTDIRNFRAFGWFNDQPTTNFRVAMKAAAVADTINRYYLQSEPPAGSLLCDKTRGALVRCLFEKAGSKSDCFEKHCHKTF